MADKKLMHLVHLKNVALEDAMVTEITDTDYAASWKKRGGVGAFMMLARKWDRLENTVEQAGYDIFQAVAKDSRPEGAIDDIRDLRRYLLLVEAELRLRYGVPLTERDKKSLDRYQDRVAKQELQWSAAETELGNPAVSYRDQPAPAWQGAGWFDPIPPEPSKLYEHDPHEAKAHEGTSIMGGLPVIRDPKDVYMSLDASCEPRSGKDRRRIPTRRVAQQFANLNGGYARWDNVKALNVHTTVNERGQYATRRVSPERRAPAKHPLALTPRSGKDRRYHDVPDYTLHYDERRTRVSERRRDLSPPDYSKLGGD